MKFFFNLLLLAACGILASGEPNAIVNGDFKLGPAGFGVWRLVRPEVNPKFENKRLSVEDGRLVLQNPHGEYFQVRNSIFPRIRTSVSARRLKVRPELSHSA